MVVMTGQFRPDSSLTGSPAGLSGKSWDRLIAGLPGAHVLQTGEWAEFKARVGWRSLPWVWRDDQGKVVAAAMLLQRCIPLRGLAARLSVLYVPKGPLLDWADAVLRRRVLLDLAALAHQRGAIFVKIDPDIWLGRGVPGQADDRPDPAGLAVVNELHRLGWRPSDEQVQFRNTVLIDLAPSLEELFANFKQKSRYNVRLAERKGVTVRPADAADLTLLYRMYAETATRDGFVIRPEDYYLTLWSLMQQAGMAEPLLAEVEGQPVAGMVIFRFAGRAWYMHGMSRPAHREKMPNHLLQWEAIRRARSAGCHTYDLWGAPDVFDESDSMWGVYRFKEGLGGVVHRGLGAWDLPVRPVFYHLYTRILPRILDIMRSRGKEKTKRMVSM